MDRTGTSSRPLAARLLAVCAVVLGLFLMHGSPAAAADGCHGAMAGAMPMTQAAPAAMGSPATAPSAGHFAAAPHLTPVGMDGTLCVSTRAQSSPPLPAVGVPAVMVVTAWEPLGRRLAAAVARWRGPPEGGRGVLLRVCVART
ncbi:hypothetical protein [Streptomyces sp. NPDC059649]|uniref:hypothetical protein n=1 Tax=Streptomyces sp. NPDC059649 TaxID=3346895 RepID=UPI0036C363A2